jgi:microcystin-dependent protein
MGVITTGQTFASGDQVTATKLNDIANSATFTSAAATTDDSTLTLGSSKLKVKDAGITATQLATDSVITAKIQDGAVTSAKLDAAAVSVLMPTGSIMPYAGTSAPTGYLLCNETPISRSTYSALFAVIGTTYGVGDGSSTFNIPDLRGRVIAGQDDMGGTSADRLIGTISGLNGDNLGATGGTEGVTLTAAQSGLPDHTHTHLRQTNGQMADGSFNVPNINANALSTSGVTGGAQDASSAHSSVQPTIILNYIIKT